MTSFSKLVLSCAVFAAMFVGAGNAKADLILNGSFELPVVSPYLGLGNSPASGLGNILPDWGSTTTDNSRGFTQNYVYSTAFDIVSNGNQGVLMNGDGLVTTTLYQSFATTLGETYLLQFDLGRQWFSAQPPVTVTGSVSVDVALTGVTTQTFSTTGGPSFTTESLLFTAAGPSTTLMFIQSSPDANSPLLDNVRVNAVPEPSSFALLSLGGLGLAFGAYRRRFAPV